MWKYLIFIQILLKIDFVFNETSVNSITNIDNLINPSDSNDWITIEDDEPDVDDVVESVTDGLNTNGQNTKQHRRQFNTKTFYNHVNIEYDFIIIGAGSAGCTLASRLSENPLWNILLIEDGDYEQFQNSVPLYTTSLQSTSYNWKFISEPQAYGCLGMKNKRCTLPSGRSVGGSSSINTMIYSRGNRKDYDEWAINGNYGWSYTDVIDYFKKSERTHRFKNIINHAFHGKYGPVPVEHVPYRTALADRFVDAMQEIGYKEIDYNSNVQIGVAYLQATTMNGRRMSTGTAYILPYLDKRPNLHLLIRTRAIKIHINSITKKAYAVEYTRFGQKHDHFMVYAKKEIILSAGTFNSPHLLMHSGIGPTKHLQSLDIPVIADLPVGQTLYDHPMFIGLTYVLNSTGNSFNHTTINAETRRAQMLGEGPLTSISGLEVVAFLKSNRSKLSSDIPDIEILFLPSPVIQKITAENYAIENDLFETVYKPMLNTKLDTCTVTISLLHPQSTGSLTLRSNDPYEYPRIFLNYLEKDIDARPDSDEKK